ncbi:Rtr1/RPAP2 family-domain-containing protein [Xylariales sp. PMI_506]|nr:Rtr1/RPAP2 family-domain-containing protein [Xylariales sp. PMI_506]
MSSSQAPKPKKSILKPASKTLAADQAAAAQAREVATQHAHIIHHRRDLEDQITDAVVALSRHPTHRGEPYTAKSPHPADVDAFAAGVRQFQPSDYDDLIEERNANGMCGYALCPEPRMRLRGGGEWKIVGANIVPKKEIEKWCSPACARRAMYIKVQLNETAAWERIGIPSIRIELLQESGAANGEEDDPAARLAREVEGLKIEAQKKSAKDAKELALERGDAEGGNNGSRGKKRSVDVKIREKKVVAEVQPPSLLEGGHLVLEGYKTTFDTNPQASDRDDTNS